MARVQTTIPLKGTIGNVTFYTLNGTTIATAAHKRVRNPKTEAQMKQRVKLNNILNMYKSIKMFLQNNFEGVVGTKNASSFFRSHNLMLDPVWITQSQKLWDKFILAPYVVSYGRLAPIEYTYSDNVFTTNLKLGDTLVDGNTEIHELVASISNPGWTQGDRLKILLLRQDTPADINADTHKPGCSSIEIPINYHSHETLGNLFLLDVSTQRNDIQLFNNNGYLAVKADLSGVYACAFVHTRGEGQNLMSSQQKLLLSDTSVYDYFCGEEAMTAALKSYKTQGYKNK